MNWLKIIAALTMFSFFSNANAQGYCDSSGASEDGDGVITFSGRRKCNRRLCIRTGRIYNKNI
jgi:hypothetical protein